MKHPQIHATLEARGGHRFALIFRNTGDREAHLYLPNTCPGGRIENNVFQVQAEPPVRYTGAYVKRPAPTPQDFVAIPAGGTLAEEVDLASAYAVPQRGRYLAHYEAYHGSPTDPYALWEIQSNAASGGVS
jgi:hypothetical protein